MVTRKVAAAALLLFALPGRAGLAQTVKPAYPAMAPLDQYLFADEKAEISLARSAAPASIADGAEVLVLGRQGYKSAAAGSNGFVCMVERSWAQTSDQAEFWNPHMRAPHCFNAQAARSYMPIYLMKTRLLLAGKSKAEATQEVERAIETQRLPPLESGAMAYMMSKQQYLNDRDKSWHPHAMFFYPGDMTRSWAAEDPASPAMAGYDAEQRVTTLFVVAGRWSDGSAAPPLAP